MENKDNTNTEDVLQTFDESVKSNCPKVSVIIPVYNTARYIDKCIQSLKKQSLKNTEIICVNDGSTDNSLEILQKLATTDERIVVLSQENKRQGGARNYGITVARGEYIGFVDSDDWVDEDFYEKLYKFAKDTDSDIAMANMLKHKKSYTKYVINNKKSKVVSDIQDKIQVCSDYTDRFFYCMNKIYRKELLSNIRFPEKVIYEDVIFSIETLYYSGKLVLVPDVQYHYLSHPTSTVNSKSNIDKKLVDGDLSRKSLELFAYEHQIKLKEKFNYYKKEWINPLVQKHTGLYHEKYMLFGVICLKKIVKTKE